MKKTSFFLALCMLFTVISTVSVCAKDVYIAEDVIAESVGSYDNAYSLEITAKMSETKNDVLEVFVSVVDIVYELDAVKFYLDHTGEGYLSAPEMVVYPTYQTSFGPMNRYEYSLGYFMDRMNYPMANVPFSEEAYGGLKNDEELVVKYEYEISESDMTSSGQSVYFYISETEGTARIDGGNYAVTGTCVGCTYTFGKPAMHEVFSNPYSKFYAESDTWTMPNVTPGTTAGDIIDAAYSEGVDAYVKSEKGLGYVISEDEKVCTGYAVEDESGCEYVIVISGDVDGNGEVSSTDYLRIKAYFLNAFSLSGAYFTAGDVTDDGKIDSTDYLRIKSYFLGSIDLYA